MNWRRRWSGDLFVACAALSVALVTLIWSLVTLVTLDPLPHALAPTTETTTPIPETRPATVADFARMAVEADPFHAERRRPAIAFRLPGEGVSATPVEASSQTPVPVLIGTALLPEGRSFAMCRVGTEAPKVVRVGEQVGGFTLKTVTQGRAIFLNAQGGTLEVGVPKAGS